MYYHSYICNVTTNKLWNNVYYIVTIKHYHVITSDTAEMFTNHTGVAMRETLKSENVR